MGRRRDWDKVRREKTVYLRGSLRHWVDGWGPTFYDPPILREDRRKQTKDDNWALLHLDFDGSDLVIPLPLLFSETGTAIPRREFRATKVTYRCIGIDNVSRETILAKLDDIVIGSTPDKLVLFVTALSEIAYLRQIVTRGSHLTFEHEIKKSVKKHRVCRNS